MADELAQLKQQRLAQLQRQAQDQAQERAEFMGQVQMLEGMVKQHLSREALARYGNIKAVDEKKALQVCVLLGQLINENKIGMITDEQFKAVLQQLSPAKREMKITFK